MQEGEKDYFSARGPKNEGGYYSTSAPCNADADAKWNHYIMMMMKWMECEKGKNLIEDGPISLKCNAEKTPWLCNWMQSVSKNEVDGGGAIASED